MLTNTVVYEDLNINLHAAIPRTKPYILLTFSQEIVDQLPETFSFPVTIDDLDRLIAGLHELREEF